jgi:uncharacterized protein (TIGR01244 family)
VTRLIPLDERTLVAGQIEAADLAEIAAAGVTLIVNNRPDHEEPGQPTSAELRQAAEAAGLGWRDIPITAVISSDQIEEMAAALEEKDGKLLAFCRSGTRSTYLWALARGRRGADAETLIGQAAAAGYDLTPLRHALT